MPLFIAVLFQTKEGTSMRPEVHNEINSGFDYLKLDRGSKKLVCLFHGYGASMHDLFGLHDLLDPNELIDWIFPNGFLPIDMGFMVSSRAWFPIDMQALDEAMRKGTHRDFSNAYNKDFEHALNQCQIFFDHIIKGYDEVILGGFSQGAMITTHLSLRNSDKVSKLLCLSGTLIGQKELIPLLEKSAKFNFFQSHGKSDAVLGYDSAKMLFELLKLGSHQGEFVGFDGGHEIPNKVIEKLKKFI